VFCVIILAESNSKLTLETNSSLYATKVLEQKHMKDGNKVIKGDRKFRGKE